jgi:hypothetical protein
LEQNALAPHKLGRLAAGAPRVRWSRPDRGALAPDLAPGEVRLYWQRMPGAGSGTLAAAPVLARHLAAARTSSSSSASGAGDRGCVHLGPTFGSTWHTAAPGWCWQWAMRGVLELTWSGSVPAATTSRSRGTSSRARSSSSWRQPAARRAVAFLRLWTAKEGAGQGTGPRPRCHARIELRRGPGGTLRPHALPRAAGDPASWRVLAFTPEPGYRAALAIQG